MKKSVKLVVVITIAVVIMMLFTACGGKLSGTYKVVKETQHWSNSVDKLYFQGSRVTVTDMFIPVECKYEIKDGKIYMEGTTIVLGTEMSVEYDYEFRQDGDSIYLNETEYQKVD